VISEWKKPTSALTHHPLPLWRAKNERLKKPKKRQKTSKNPKKRQKTRKKLKKCQKTEKNLS
jgi:hypothetical protein